MRKEHHLAKRDNLTETDLRNDELILPTKQLLRAALMPLFQILKLPMKHHHQ